MSALYSGQRLIYPYRDSISLSCFLIRASRAFIKWQDHKKNKKGEQMATANFWNSGFLSKTYAIFNDE